MIDLKTANQLLDFGARIGGGQQAQEQLEGAVAIHNILEEHRIAYLADEVGMGKTYVALGALALFRHYQPRFRVLIIAPRENIQNKWMKELRNFVAHNVRFPDLRVKALDERPVVPLVACGNLRELVHQATVDPDRDFFLRLSSFSLPFPGKDTIDPEAARRFRDSLRQSLPWMRDEVFDLRNRRAFKDNMAKAVCCGLPPFDLVIVDEGHNLRHGFGERVAARNRVLALAMGYPDDRTDKRLFPGYGPRARRVLLLSATPVEESYRHLWNQLHVFGQAGPFDGLLADDLEEDKKKAIAGQFLVRRVTVVKIGETDYTKNLYRREWRRGGVKVHDQPVRVDDPKQRLIVALIQKKVSELLGHERFNNSFQVGMLASFESFLETTRVKRGEEEESNFDGVDQTEDELEREGIDVADVNRISRSYRTRFHSELPHPKMDAVVESLSDAWRRGDKALIFVRRVASVKELKRKLDERYDAWLIARLLKDLPENLHDRLQRSFAQYQQEQVEAGSRDGRPPAAGERREGADEIEMDLGGRDTFFAWFFRGEGPRGVVSGANIQQRFIQRSGAYATFFEDNYVAEVLGCPPGEVERTLSAVLGVESGELRRLLRERSKKFLSRAKKHARADRFEAVQGAAIEWLKEQAGTHQEQARIVWHQRFEASVRRAPAAEAPEIGDWLTARTFFTALRERKELREHLWPQSRQSDPVRAFREAELRGQLLASAARLGHPLIDLYTMIIRRLGSLEQRVQESADAESEDLEVSRIDEYLDLLENQMRTPRGERDWGSFDELADIADNFNLLIDVNEPDALEKPLAETARVFGRLLGQQQPIGGMSGQVNQTLVRQFRMPGYPLVLVSTDLLQEGEDLHTFCSAVHHYGIAWTPSSMEQRIGRIDRVRSQTERRLTAMLERMPEGDELLQVYFPHLEDTIEILQVQRVLERMNVFLRLIHEGLITEGGRDGSLHTVEEFVRGVRLVPQIRERLKSAFPVRAEQLGHGPGALAVDRGVARDLKERFARIAQKDLPGLRIAWEPQTEPGRLLGTARLGERHQPFALILRSVEAHPVVRCVSPVGNIDLDAEMADLVASSAMAPVRIGAFETREEGTYDLTVEEDVLFGADEDTGASRVGMLLRRVVEWADALEQEHLPGRDETMATLQGELGQEGNDGR